MWAAQRVEATGGKPWVRAALRCGAMLAVAALALPLAGTAYAAPEPQPTITVAPGADPLASAKATLGPLLQRLHQLYTEAEAATETYNTSVDRLKQQQTALADLGVRLARQQAAVDAGTDVAAQLAGAQYRNGNASEFADLLLAKDPYEAVVIAELLQAAGRSQSVFLDKLKADRAELTGLQQQAQAAQAQAQALATQQEQSKNEAAKRLQAVEDMVGSLTGAQRSELEQLEKQQADEAQLAFLASGALGKGERTPSAAGRKAVAYALAQLGKDYLWGGEGSEMFDCSGLTSQAWLHAGRPIPRTSQEQWAELQHVPLNQLRPGDLVIYHAEATHVAMYIGGGLVVQAPHTGAVVKISPVGMMPILGAVRPDPGAGADDQGGAWKVPDVAQSANDVTPIKPSKPSTLPKPAPTGTPSPTATPSTSPSTSPSGTPSSTPSGSPSTGGPGTPSATPSGSGSPSPSGSLSSSGSPSPSDRG
ncbi:C40 family peptidase [Saccharothrix sp. ST-888]|uniref:C40 family peptidase n=1 Tax=Saccharothrix sp. ST-888 TaxID=1427391 RepID=UPI000698683D|nr:NlpC/P60 family protein [Saccharothrix sp. ST-888]